MSDPRRKPRRLTVLLPFILLALVAGGWSIFWFTTRDRIEQGFDDQAKALRDRGYEVAWASREVGGFPFRFSINLTDAAIVEPGGWGVRAPRLDLMTAAYAPDVIAIVAPAGVVLNRPDGRAFNIRGKVLRASIGGYSKVPPRISIEGVDLTIATRKGEAASFPAIKRFEAHVRPLPGDKAMVSLSAQDATIAGESLLSRMSGDRTLSARIAGQASSASELKGAGWPGVIAAWSSAGGGFDISEGGVKAGEMELTLKPSRIAADANGAVTGSLVMSVAKAKEGLLTLGALKAIPMETAAAASGLAGITEIVQPSLDLTLGFRQGRTHLGPLPVGPAPRFY